MMKKNILWVVTISISIYFLFVACLAPVNAVTTKTYSWYDDGGNTESVRFTGNNSVAIAWQSSGLVWDIYLFTAAQNTAWWANGKQINSSSVATYLHSTNGSIFKVGELSASEIYWFVAYVRELSNFRALYVTIIWDNVTPGSDIPGFEIIGLLLALAALLVVSLKKKSNLN